MAVGNIAEKVEAEYRRELEEQEGAQPDLEAAFLHLTAQGLEI